MAITIKYTANDPRTGLTMRAANSLEIAAYIKAKSIVDTGAMVRVGTVLIDSAIEGGGSNNQAWMD